MSQYALSFATYATLAELRMEIGVNDATVTAGDPAAIRALISATARIDLELPGKAFLPRAETRYFDAYADTEGLDLRLSELLAEVTSVTNGDGSALTDADYTLIPKAGAPYSRVRLKAAGAVAWQADSSGDPVDAIQVAGIWHSTRPHSGQWYATGETITLASTTTASFTPASPGGADAFRRTPRFSEGMLLKWTVGGVTEYAEIVRIESGTGYLNRGVRGTTAVTPTSAAVSAWQVDPVIAKACARLASWYYKRAGNFAEANFNAATGMGERLPKDMPQDVTSILDHFKGANTPTMRILEV